MDNLIVKGGWVMVPILLGSVVALTLVLERLWFFWEIRLKVPDFTEEIFSLVRRKNIPDAVARCEKSHHPLARAFKAGLEHASAEAAEIERVIEREGNRQVQKVEKNLNFLAVVIGVEPLLGFLGTILGLIRAFMAWEKLGASVSVSALAGGIYQAMITTAAGLIIAIPYYVIYNMFLSKVNETAQDLSHYGDELVGILEKSKLR